MLDIKPSLESPIKVEEKKVLIDSNVFGVCTSKCTPVRKIFKKKLVYAHHDGKKLNITVVDPFSSDIIQKN